MPARAPPKRATRHSGVVHVVPFTTHAYMKKLSHSAPVIAYGPRKQPTQLGEYMTTTGTYEVSTKVLADQGRVLIRQLEASENATRLSELATFGLKAQEYLPQLKSAVQDLEDAEAEQERAKQAYQKETDEDAVLVDQGYTWVMRLHAIARAYLAGELEDKDDLAGTLRFGHLRVARARGVTYEMRILLPLEEDLLSTLQGFGGGQAFFQEGRDILTKLGVELKETAEAKAVRQKLTRRVRAAEVVASRAYRRLLAADEAAALTRPEKAPVFRLDVISAEIGRLAAARAAKVNANAGTPVTEDD